MKIGSAAIDALPGGATCANLTLQIDGVPSLQFALRNAFKSGFGTHGDGEAKLISVTRTAAATSRGARGTQLLERMPAMTNRLDEITQPAVVTLDQLTLSVNDLLSACDAILLKHAIVDKDDTMMQMLMLSVTLGAVISTCPAHTQELVMEAALANLKKGIAAAAANPQLQHLATQSGVVH